jgi:mediator of RNA polymerase II transcription subunit 16
VAYIAPGGKTVNLRVFSRDPSTGKWDIENDTPIELPPGYNDYAFEHISWSHLGNDLAIMNAAGHVVICSCAMALDRMSFSRLEPGPPETDMDAVVGMLWLAILPYEQKVASPLFCGCIKLMLAEPYCLGSQKRTAELEV